MSENLAAKTNQCSTVGTLSRFAMANNARTDHQNELPVAFRASAAAIRSRSRSSTRRRALERSRQIASEAQKAEMGCCASSEADKNAAWEEERAKKERELKQIAASLTATPFFLQLSDEELEEFAGHFSLHLFAPGVQIVRQGDAADSFYVLSSGSLEICALCAIALPTQWRSYSHSSTVHRHYRGLAFSRQGRRCCGC